LVVLEGLHSVKHALRFDATLLGLWSDQPEEVIALAHDLAPDIAAEIARRLELVTPERFATLTPRPPAIRLIAIAEKPAYHPENIGRGPVVLLERPRHPGNLGAVIRVAAAAEAAAVGCLGGIDPWSAASLRGAAGLHFALPVLALETLGELDRPIVALDDQGVPLGTAPLPVDAVFAFGSERTGLGTEIRARAVRTVAIPMRSGVSSLNLATAVAVVLYGLARGTGQPRRAPT
jgi:TrmH family RNA methyltransferase